MHPTVQQMVIALIHQVVRPLPDIDSMKSPPSGKTTARSVLNKFQALESQVHSFTYVVC